MTPFSTQGALLQLSDLKGTKVISSTAVPHPIPTPTFVKNFNNIIIVIMDTKVHIHDIGDSNFVKFQNFVVSSGYLEKRYNVE